MVMDRLIVLSFALLFVSGCTLGPDFFRPASSVDVSAGFINEISVSSDKKKSVNRWWERIEDPLLDGYVVQLLESNLALREASERIIQASERSKVARGDYAPVLGGGGAGGRSFVPGTGAQASERIYTNSYSAELTASWQIDLFGKIRRSVEAANAGFKASVYDRQALTHSLIAELLNRRVAIAIHQNLRELARQNAKNRQNIYELVKRRYDLGVRGTALSDVYLAEDSFTSVASDAYRFERLLVDDVYRLDVLLGQLPGTTNVLQGAFPLLPLPLDVPACMPANLLDRRPDLRASELRLKAANADVGIAIADLYPSLNLGGALGFSGNETRNFFTADQLAGSILASLTTRLFEGGKLRANIRLQESEVRELAAGYAEDVLNAVREVETALQAEQKLDSEIHNTQRSVDALRKAEQLSQERYIRGILTLKDYLDIQQRRYFGEQALLATQQEKWNVRVSLYMALGGDWLGDPAVLKDNVINACETAGVEL